MAFADSSTYFDTGDSSIVGIFTEAEVGNYFEYSENNDDVFTEYPHKIWVTTPKPGIDQGYRYGRVMKTRCKILLDEDQEETWHFKQNSRREYPNKKKEKVWDLLKNGAETA